MDHSSDTFHSPGHSVSPDAMEGSAETGPVERPPEPAADLAGAPSGPLPPVELPSLEERQAAQTPVMDYHVNDDPGDRLPSGRLLADSLSTLVRQPMLTLGLSLVAFSPLAFGSILLAIAGSEEMGVALSGMALVLVLMTLFLPVLVVGAMTHGIYRHRVGDPIPVGTSVGRVGPRALPLIGLAVAVAGLVFIGSLFVYGLPALLVIASLWVAVPVLIIEGSGVVGSMKRSYDLTEGRRLSVLSLTLLFVATQYLVEWGSGQVQEMLVGAEVALAWAEGAAESFAPHQILLLSGLDLLGPVLLTAYFSVLKVLTYFELRRLRDGTSLEDLAPELNPAPALERLPLEEAR